MSRIGKLPITIPAGVTVEIKDGGSYGHQLVTVTGPKGTLTESLRRGVTASMENGVMMVARDNDEKQNRSYHGLYRSLLNNLVTGVTTGFRKDLQIVGIGYRGEMQGEKAVFSLGYAHRIEYMPPAGITVKIENQTDVSIEGIDRQLVGEVAAKIRDFRKPEPYKGKGIRYKDEQVRRKSVKKGSA